MLLVFYSWLSYVLAPLLWLYSFYKSRKYDDCEKRLKNHCGKATLSRPDGKIVWMHAASVGETLTAITLLEHLKSLDSQLKFLITTTTKTAANLLLSRFELNPLLSSCCVHQYAPIDVYPWCKRFIDYWHPDVALFFESELWPNLIKVASDKSIKLGLINARVSVNSLKNWQKFSASISKVLEKFSVIIAQSQYDADNIQNFVKQKVGYYGNLKHSAEKLPINESVLKSMGEFIKDKFIFIAASTHKGEEEEIIRAHRILKQSYDIFTILAPRHPNRCQDIGLMCFNEGFNYLRRSQVGNAINSNTEVYIVDTIGELGTFYSMAEIAFVGGSIVSHGGHNILEPAKLSCSVMHGSYMHNFKELDETFRRADASVVVHDGKELAEEVIKQIEDKKKLKTLQQNAFKVATSQYVILEKVANAIKGILP